MKYIPTDKIKGFTRCCCDVGTIVKVDDLFFDQGCGCGFLHLSDRLFYITDKALAVIRSGYATISTADKTPKKRFPCNDPRVLYMYLWPFWKHHLGSEDENPPVPTMEEARAWMAEAGIPAEPDENRDFSKSSARYFGFRV